MADRCRTAIPGNWAWRCQECGHRFRSAAAAERAAFGDRGCPKCGASDVDESLPVRKDAGDDPNG